jgi:hypothetical protein
MFLRVFLLFEGENCYMDAGLWQDLGYVASKCKHYGSYNILCNKRRLISLKTISDDGVETIYSERDLRALARAAVHKK